MILLSLLIFYILPVLLGLIYLLLSSKKRTFQRNYLNPHDLMMIFLPIVNIVYCIINWSEDWPFRKKNYRDDDFDSFFRD